MALQVLNFIIMDNMNPIRKPVRFRFFNATLVIIAINVFVFLLNQMVPITRAYLGLLPQAGVINNGFYWQFLTYMFVHGGFSHILFNMLGLFIFGTQLEKHMGSTEFLILYFFTGIGTGVVSFFLGINVVGASGAIYGLLLAFATYFPTTRIFIMGILPLRAPIAVLIFTAMSLVFQFTGMMGGVAHFAHLAGIVLAYLYFLVRLRINPIRVFLEKR